MQTRHSPRATVKNNLSNFVRFK